MKQKDITARMEVAIKLLKRGKISIYECEKMMTEAILDGTLEMPCDTYEQQDKRITTARKLKRRMWRMLLEATK